MNCERCGAELPAGAMFCGECGRAAGPRSAPVAEVVLPASPPRTPTVRDTVALDRNWLSAEFEFAPVMLPARDPEPQPEPEPAFEPETASEPALESEPTVHPEPQAEADPETADEAGPSLEAEAEPKPGPEAALGDEAEPETLSESESEPEPDSAPAFLRDPESASHDSAPESREPVPERDARPAATPAAVWDPPVPTSRLVQAPATGTDEIEDNELTRIVPRRSVGVRFVLQFSTGESVVVSGSGLLGRNPLAEPSEAFDHLVPITDSGKSVSKTHLEFGQEQGAFWVLDRYSANGSVIREPGVTPRRLEPGRRYRVTRGARVDIGEQFIVVS